VLQYVRLMLVVSTAPLLVRFVLAPHGSYAAVGAKEIEAVASLHGYGFTIGLALLGAADGTRLRIPAGALLVALFLTALGGALGLYNDLQPPETVREPAFIIIGVAVGLGFDLAVPAGRHGRSGRHRPDPGHPRRLRWPCSFAYRDQASGAARRLPCHHPRRHQRRARRRLRLRREHSLVIGMQGVRLSIMVLAAPVPVRFLVLRQRRPTRAAP